MFGWDTLWHCVVILVLLGRVETCWRVGMWRSVFVRILEVARAGELEARSLRGTTALHIAVAGGNRIVAELLLENRAGTQRQTYTVADGFVPHP